MGREVLRFASRFYKQTKIGWLRVKPGGVGERLPYSKRTEMFVGNLKPLKP